jgi:hypothetical protein
MLSMVKINTSGIKPPDVLLTDPFCMQQLALSPKFCNVTSHLQAIVGKPKLVEQPLSGLKDYVTVL